MEYNYTSFQTTEIRPEIQQLVTNFMFSNGLYFDGASQLKLANDIHNYVISWGK